MRAGAAAVLSRGLFLGLLLLMERRAGWLAHLDAAVADALHGWALRHAGAVDVLVVLQAALSPEVFRLLVIAAAVVLWRSGDRRRAGWAVVTSVVGGLLGVVLKLLVHRPRPSFPDPVSVSAGYGFPSGHALGSFLSAGILLVLFVPALTSGARRAAYALATALVLLTGLDRLALGVHTVSDVVGGWLVAAALLAAVADRLRRSP